MSSPKFFSAFTPSASSENRPQSIIEVYFEASRRDARMRQFLERAKEAGCA